jgi:adenylate cyclase
MRTTGAVHRPGPSHQAIMNADVVAYSAMIALDAPATIASLRHNLRWICSALEPFDGRLLDAVGDNFMAQFPDEQAAVLCSTLIQRCEPIRNHGVPEHARVRLRIGIHAGPVFACSGRAYGDVVNVAARLQSAAPSGGLMMSALVADRCYRQLRSFHCIESLPALKNIPFQLPAVTAVLR